MRRRMRVPSARPGPRKLVTGGAVGLVVAGFEDVGDAEVGGDALDGVGHGAGVLLALDDAGAGDEEERGRGRPGRCRFRSRVCSQVKGY